MAREISTNSSRSTRRSERSIFEYMLWVMPIAAAMSSCLRPDKCVTAQDLIENNFGTAAIMLAGGWKTERMVAKYGRKLSASRNAMAQLQRKRSES